MTTSYSNLSSSSKLASNIFHKHTYDIAIIPKGKDITDLGVKSTKSGDVIVIILVFMITSVNGCLE